MATIDDLNKAQMAAATAGDGPLSIIAGPGTGKTKTLTARIAYLVGRQNVAPQTVLALTFTNKAAREMQERVAAALGNHKGTPHVTTFHGLCYELLKGNAAQLQIISETDRFELLRELRSQQVAELPLRELSAQISRLKNMPEMSDTNAAGGLVELLKTYNKTLRTQGRYDFDDLLQEVYSRLMSDTAFRADVQKRWRYILVDEFQDTNELQYELLKNLASHDNFFVIGDPLQSIYGFRGAAGDIFERFATDFPNVRRINLTANYRSRPQIVAVANALFANAPQLVTQTPTRGVAEAVEVLNEYREAAWIVQTIEQDLGGTDFQRSHQLSGNEQARRFGDYAVLYRTHHVARTLKRAFAESGIPFQCVGDDSPFAQKPLRTAVAALRRACLGDSKLAPAELRLLAKIPLRTLDNLNAQRALAPTKFLEYAAKELALLSEDKPEAQRDFHQALGTFVRFDMLAPEEFLTVFDDLAEQAFFDPAADAVTLLTIHASKGLEFAHVFIIAAEDGVLPHVPKHGISKRPLDVNEEKRLFYVAVTRARDRLTLLHAQTRACEPATLSPFAQALDPKVLPHALDPNLAAQARAQTKRHLKNAQGSLF